MTDITEGFTSISAGCDSIEPVLHDELSVSGPTSEMPREPRSPTGARVTVEFHRESALPPAQRVRVRYDFAGDGNLREGTGVVDAIKTVVRLGHVVVYHYRMSYWIAPAQLMEFLPGNVRYRTEERGFPPHPSEQQTPVVG